MKQYLCNVLVGSSNSFFQPFSVVGYTFHSLAKPEQSGRVYTSIMASRDNRKIRRNAYVVWHGKQQDAIINCNRRYYWAPDKYRKAKLLHDILMIGSVLTGANWVLHSRRWEDRDFPVAAANHLRMVSHDKRQLAEDCSDAIGMLQDQAWCAKFKNGFHIRMLLNSSNVGNSESRVLAYFVIWEFLYTRIFQKESNNLHEIVAKLLEHFWPGAINKTIFLTHKENGLSKNILYVLRNQLAHNGQLPIDRPYAEPWMKLLPVSSPYASLDWGVDEYMRFFEDLTEVIVFKTLGMNTEDRLAVWDFATHLQLFLSTGRVR